MPDVIEQLQQYADAVARTVPAVDREAARPPRERRRPWLVGAAAAVVLALLGTAAVLLTRDEPVQVRTDPPVSEPPEVTPTTVEEETPTTGPATRTLRTFPVVAFTGTEYLVWSGEAGANDTSHRADGFAVDVRTGDVRAIAVAPIDPRSGATGAWTGEELIVCCGTGQLDGFGGDTRSAAAWDPQTGAWRTLAPPPERIARSYPTSVWTGDAMVVVATGPAAATYDPATDRWTEITPPPLAGGLPESVWTGAEVIVWDSRYGSGAVGADDIADVGWSWAPGVDAWTPLPALPSGRRIQLGSIAWTGTELVVWGQSTTDEALGIGARWRPGTDAWRPMAPSPQGPVPDPYNGTPGSQALTADGDGRVLVKGLDGGGAAGLYLYDPARDTWSTTPLVVDGFHPVIRLVDGLVLVPDADRPIVGDLTP